MGGTWDGSRDWSFGFPPIQFVDEVARSLSKGGLKTIGVPVRTMSLSNHAKDVHEHSDLLYRTVIGFIDICNYFRSMFAANIVPKTYLKYSDI